MAENSQTSESWETVLRNIPWDVANNSYVFKAKETHNDRGKIGSPTPRQFSVNLRLRILLSQSVRSQSVSIDHHYVHRILFIYAPN